MAQQILDSQNLEVRRERVFSYYSWKADSIDVLPRDFLSSTVGWSDNLYLFRDGARHHYSPSGGNFRFWKLELRGRLYAVGDFWRSAICQDDFQREVRGFIENVSVGLFERCANSTRPSRVK